jgi:1,5-anhydro-D-fructose reductase (1,5-anhydro-D-mannitol-forming)
MPNLALVGASHIHTPGFIKKIKDRPDITVKFVWDRLPAVAQRQAAELGAAVAASPDQVWSDGDISAVVICSETSLHKDLVLPAAAARKHIFAEKPLGFSAQDAAEMALAIEQAGVLFQTGYFNRGNPIYLFLRQHIAQGSFGRITRIRHSNCHHGGIADWFVDKDWSWMTDPAQAGFGGFGDLGTHSLDLILWLMQRPVEKVSASIQTATARFGPECDEFGEGLLLFAGGVVGSLAAAWVDVANPVTFQLSGMEGAAWVVDGKLYFKSQHVAGADGAAPWTDLPPAWPHAFDIFLDAVSGKPHAELVTPREAALNSAVMEALYQSARQQAWVEL